MAEEKLAGQVVHVFDKILVAVLKLEAPLRLGDRLHFRGTQTDVVQEITSMQVDHQPVEKAAAGTEVAVKLSEAVRRGDSVYRVKD